MKTQMTIHADVTIQAFRVSRIVFDDTDLVSANVACRFQGALRKTTLLFTFSVFNDLLRFSGESGDKLQQLVCDKLWSNEEHPYIIDISHEPMLFAACSASLSYLIDQDDTCFHVEQVMPLSLLQQAKNLRTNIQDFQHVHIDNRKYLSHSLQEIASMYRYYCGLTELNLNDKSAREKSGLLNDKLFRMAYHAAKTIRVSPSERYYR